MRTYLAEQKGHEKEVCQTLDYKLTQFIKENAQKELDSIFNKFQKILIFMKVSNTKNKSLTQFIRF